MRNNEFKTDTGETLEASNVQEHEDIGQLNKGDYIELYDKDDNELECMVTKKTLTINGYFKFIVRIIGSVMIGILLINLDKFGI